MSRLWSDEEVNILMNNLDKDINEIMEMLPGRNIDYVRMKRRSIQEQIRRNTLNEPRTDWTSSEIHIIEQNGHLTNNELLELLPNRTLFAIAARRYQLGLVKDNRFNDEEDTLICKLKKEGCRTRDIVQHINNLECNVNRGLERSAYSIESRYKRIKNR